MSRARSVADLGNQSLNLGISDGGLTIGTGVTIENTGKSQFAGIVTASKFVGDGSGLTGVTGTGSGVVIQEEGTNVGTAATINFVGSAVTAAISGGVATVEISSSGGGGGDTVSINATADDILSVSSGNISADDAGADKLVFWDDSAGKLTYLTVGSNLTVTNTTIAASGGGGGISNVVDDTSPQLGGNLDVNGKDIVSTSNGDIDFTPNGTGAVVFKGVTSNGGNGAGRFKLNCENNSHGITIQGPPHSAGANYTLTLPNDDGSSGTYLKSDGSGNLSWDTPSSGISNIVEDTTPQLGGNLDLNTKEITGNGNVNLTGDGYFSGDLSLGNYYNPTIDLNGASGDAKLIGTTKLGGNVSSPNITLFKSGDSTFAGVITATKFVGDGSGLTGVTGSGSGIAIKDDGNTVGTAGTINFGSNLSVSAISAGIVTITASGGGGGSYGDSDVDSHLNVSGASSGQILSWNGSDYAWVADQTGGGGGTGYFDNNQTNVGIHTTASHVGFGTTNPITSVQINNVYGIETESGTFTASAGVAYTANTYASTNFVNAEYTLFFSHLSGIQSQKILVMDNNSTAYSQEYAIMNSSNRLVSVGATIKSGNVELQWTPETGINGTIAYRFTRETMI